jgi:hypothetical protein
MSRRPWAVGLVVGMLLAGCGGTSGAAVADPDTLCPPPDIEMDGAIDVAARCQLVLSLADARLGVLHWPVTEVDVRWNLCPPGARCAFLPLSQAWVIYQFSIGEPVMIHVRSTPDVVEMTDELIAGDPEPLPDWLLEELQADSSAR